MDGCLHRLDVAFPIARRWTPHPDRVDLLGSSVKEAMVGRHVAFEADGHDLEEGWSVIVKGRAYVLGVSELVEAERGQVLPWTTTVKARFIRIVPTEISGRRFRFGGESE